MAFQWKLEKVDLVITDTPTNVKYTVIELNLYLMVHSIVLKFEKIWLSGTLNIIRKPKKSLFSKRKRAITQER
jgi:DNA modification methylase